MADSVEISPPANFENAEQNAQNPMCHDIVLRHMFSLVSLDDLTTFNLVNKKWWVLCNMEIRKRSMRRFEFEPSTTDLNQAGNPHGLVKSKQFLSVMKESQLMPFVSFQFRMKGYVKGSKGFFQKLIQICGKDMQRLEVIFGYIGKKQLNGFNSFLSEILEMTNSAGALPLLKYFSIYVCQPEGFEFEDESNALFQEFFVELFRVAPNIDTLDIKWHSRVIDVTKALCTGLATTGLNKLNTLHLSVYKVSKENLLELGSLIKLDALNFEWRIATFDTEEMKSFLNTLAPKLTYLQLYGHQHSHTDDFNYTFPVMPTLRKLSIMNKENIWAICSERARGSRRGDMETSRDIKLSGILWYKLFPKLEEFAWTHTLKNEYEVLFAHKTGPPHPNVRRLTVPYGFDNLVMLTRMAAKFPNVNTIKLNRDMQLIQAACTLMKKIETIIIQFSYSPFGEEYYLEREERQQAEMRQYFLDSASELKADPTQLTAFLTSIQNVKRMFVQQLGSFDDMKIHDVGWFLRSIRDELD